MAFLRAHAILSPFNCSAGVLRFCVVLCVAAAFALLCQAQPVTEGETELRLVQVVFRHGNRTPELPYGNDPNANYDFYPFGWDELDRFGRQSSFELGRYLRKRYGNFAEDYAKEEVDIYCTDIRRVRMATQLVAAGLFPPSEPWQWGLQGELGGYWQPITFKYKPLEQDNFLYMKKAPCPLYTQELRKIDQGPVMEEGLAMDPELVEVFISKAGISRSVHPLCRVWQTMDIEHHYNLTIPDWAKPFYPDRLLRFVKYHFRMNSWTKTMQKLRAGPLLGNIFKEMEAKAKGSQMKMVLYSGHDDTVANLGIAMGVWDDFLPVFSSAMILELHSDNTGAYYVKTFFHNDTEKSPIPLTVPGCDALCPLSSLRSILNDVISVNHTKECMDTRSAAVVGRPHLLMLLLSISLYVFQSL